MGNFAIDKLALDRGAKLTETRNQKGRQVYVEGRLRTREFEVKNNDGKRQRTEIVAARV